MHKVEVFAFIIGYNVPENYHTYTKSYQLSQRKCNININLGIQRIMGINYEKCVKLIYKKLVT